MSNRDSRYIMTTLLQALQNPDPVSICEWKGVSDIYLVSTAVDEYREMVPRLVTKDNAKVLIEELYFMGKYFQLLELIAYSGLPIDNEEVVDAVEVLKSMLGN